MQQLSDADLALVLGGEGLPSFPCTFGNPTGAAPAAPQPPQQFFSAGQGGPSANARVMSSTNTLTSRGLGMLNDGTPGMADQW